ncbi:MAG: hypothetical protein EOO88_18695 [Pedobacter sp.]|nr:MAG: hypothetical protein EOO88_18695 [Pedobacter sp.]
MQALLQRFLPLKAEALPYEIGDDYLLYYLDVTDISNLDSEGLARRLEEELQKEDSASIHVLSEVYETIDWRRESPTKRVEGLIISASVLMEIEGLKGEHTRMDSPESQLRIQKLVESLAVKGFQPNSPVTIIVAPGKLAKVYEGNHRIRAAFELGLSVRADVFYLRGAEKEGFLQN